MAFWAGRRAGRRASTSTVRLGCLVGSRATAEGTNPRLVMGPGKDSPSSSTVLRMEAHPPIRGHIANISGLMTFVRRPELATFGGHGHFSTLPWSNSCGRRSWIVLVGNSVGFVERGMEGWKEDEEVQGGVIRLIWLGVGSYGWFFSFRHFWIGQMNYWRIVVPLFHRALQ